MPLPDPYVGRKKNFHIFIFRRFNRAPHLWLFFIILPSVAQGKILEILFWALLIKLICEISGFRRGVVEAFALPGCYAPQLDTLRWDQETVRKRRKPTRNLGRITYQKSERLVLIIFFPLAYYISTCLTNICFCFWINILNYVLSAASLNTSRNLIFVACKLPLNYKLSNLSVSLLLLLVMFSSL